MREIRVTKYYTNSNGMELFILDTFIAKTRVGLDWNSKDGTIEQAKEALKKLCEGRPPGIEFKPLKPKTGEEIFFLDWD